MIIKQTSSGSLDPPMTLKLDLACGQRKQEGFTGVDIVDIDGVDQVTDLLTFPWPWDNDSVSEVHCAHFVEHIPHWRPGYEHDGLILFMNELYRIMEPDGKARIIHPYLKSDRAFQDPTHTRFLPDSTWWYFNEEWRKDQLLTHYPITTNFELVGIENGFLDGGNSRNWAMKAAEAQEFAVGCYWNVISDLIVHLRAIK